MVDIRHFPGISPKVAYEQFLAEHGLDADDQAAMGLSLVTPEDIQSLMKWEAPAAFYGILIPYGDMEQGGFWVIRKLGEIKKGSAKYLTPPGSGAGPVYLPPWNGLDWADIRVDVSVPLVITEGQFKAYTGCKHGGRVVGLNGVDMAHALFDGTWEWRGRPIVLAFDHDPFLKDGTPIAPGEYKPEVAAALDRLATQLSAQRANVTIASVGLAAVSAGLDPRLKWGLDDYLNRAGGSASWPALLATCQSPEDWCEDLGLLLANCVLIQGVNTPHVYDLRFGSRQTLKGFNEAWGYITVARVNESGKTVILKIPDLWYRHRMMLKADSYCMDPKSEPGVIVRRGRPMINLWRPYPDLGPMSPAAEAVLEGWQKYVEGLFGDHWRWVCLWVAHMLERPWEQTNQGVMLITKVGGIGKSLFSEIVAEMVGGEHSLEVSPSDLFNHFNAELEGKVWCHTHELDVKFSAHEGQMNELLSKDTFTMVQKGRDAIVLPNLTRRYFTTNVSSPCRLSKGQRRILVVHPPRVMEDTRGPWGLWVGSEVAAWKRDRGALAAIRWWFERLWIERGEGWVPTSPVPITEAAEELAEASMTGVQVLAESIIGWIRENGGVGAVLDDRKRVRTKVWGEVSELVQAYGGLCGRKLIKVYGRGTNATIYDLHRCLESRTDGGHRYFTIESSRVKDIAVDLELLISKAEFDLGVR